MNDQFDQRGIINSFVEGLTAPWIELTVSLTIISSSSVFEILQDAIRELFSTSFNTSIMPYPTDLVLIFARVLLLVSLLDLARNLVIGFLYPANAFAHILGEFISLILFFKAFYLILKSIIIDSLLASSFLIIGIVLRAYIEYRNDKSKDFYF